MKESLQSLMRGKEEHILLLGVVKKVHCQSILISFPTQIGAFFVTLSPWQHK